MCLYVNSVFWTGYVRLLRTIQNCIKASGVAVTALWSIFTLVISQNEVAWFVVIYQPTLEVIHRADRRAPWSFSTDSTLVTEASD